LPGKPGRAPHRTRSAASPGSYGRGEERTTRRPPAVGASSEAGIAGRRGFAGGPHGSRGFPSAASSAPATGTEVGPRVLAATSSAGRCRLSSVALDVPLLAVMGVGGRIRSRSSISFSRSPGGRLIGSSGETSATRTSSRAPSPARLLPRPRCTRGWPTISGARQVRPRPSKQSSLTGVWCLHPSSRLVAPDAAPTRGRLRVRCAGLHALIDEVGDGNSTEAAGRRRPSEPPVLRQSLREVDQEEIAVELKAFAALLGWAPPGAVADGQVIEPSPETDSSDACWIADDQSPAQEARGWRSDSQPGLTPQSRARDRTTPMKALRSGPLTISRFLPDLSPGC
jgi:hypothetical protein